VQAINPNKLKENNVSGWSYYTGFQIFLVLCFLSDDVGKYLIHKKVWNVTPSNVEFLIFYSLVLVDNGTHVFIE
jgi:hypothetical protein